MPADNELRQLQAEISARSHAMSTQPLGSDRWNANASRLRESLEDASVLIELGRGVASPAVWSAFLATVQSQSHSLSAEVTLVNQGQTQRPSERQEVAYQEAPERVIPGLSPGTRRAPTRTAAPVATEPPSTTAQAAVTTVPTTTAGAVVTGKTAPPAGWVAPTSGGAPNVQAASVLPSVLPPGAPSAFMNWLNPSTRPVYQRPWFIGTAVLAVAGVTYYSMKNKEEKVD